MQEKLDKYKIRQFFFKSSKILTVQFDLEVVMRLKHLSLIGQSLSGCNRNKFKNLSTATQVSLFLAT